MHSCVQLLLLKYLTNVVECMPENSCSIRFLYGDQARFFDDEIRPELRHSKTGTVAMASAGENCNASQVKCLPSCLIDDI
jgi:hypothetical protein